MSVSCQHCGAVASYGQELGHKSNCPSLIMGHKTFNAGEVCQETEPLTRSETDALWRRAKQAEADRAVRMPDERAAINAMWDAYQRLTELGWRDPSYCPKDGTHFKVIEPGSTGIHDANYHGSWPTGGWWIYDGDVWPSLPVMFKLYPAEQAKEDERWRIGRERLRDFVSRT